MLNPAILFPMIWIFVITLSFIIDLDFYEYSDIFYTYIVISLVVFSMSAILGGIFSKAFPYKSFFAIRKYIALKTNINFYIAMMLIIIILQISDHIYMFGYDWWTMSNIVSYRYRVTEIHESIHFGWVSLFNFFFFSILPLMSILRTNNWQKIIIYLLILIFIYINSARGPILVILLVYYFFDWLKNGFNLRQTLVLTSIFLLSFSAIAIMTGKVGGQFSVLAYALAPSHAFDIILNGRGNDGNHEFYSFSILQKFFYLLGFTSEITSKNLDFYYTPIATNVYTIFGPYLLDFGTKLSILFIAGIGFLCGFIYKLAKKKDNYLVFLCSITTSLLFLSIFHDYFTSAGFVWGCVFLGFIFFPLEKNFCNTKN